ncbi:probable zinc transporter 8 [Cucurbita pepo subsp. pepo]|uniref:probable zinc transporter 8 n=1 Tax=Cucurbita pepo subsp. pepo TaxID=3664 RepID=UPI000C9D8F85|nr:probable zinc transporter 8 [Cucurbita pepo subsp. pepo]
MEAITVISQSSLNPLNLNRNQLISPTSSISFCTMARDLRLHALIVLLLLVSFWTPSCSESIPTPNSQCQTQLQQGCHDRHKSLKLKLIAIATILVASMIGVCLPLFSRAVPLLQPEGSPFAIVKAFASGVILATGYMHVLPDSFNCLTSPCLPENPWRKFPFTTFIAMISAVMTLMLDSFSMSRYKKELMEAQVAEEEQNEGMEIDDNSGREEGTNKKLGAKLVRHRVIAQLLEAGIVVHSVVIGLSMGASENPCTIRPLIAALCFHQLFEGMGLGGCILQAEYGFKMKAIMVFFFSITTPFGIALGIGLSNVYSDNSPTALIVVGVLNALSAGLLNYMALVDLLAFDFMGPKLQANLTLHIWAYVAVFLGAGGMSLMAKWA